MLRRHHRDDRRRRPSPRSSSEAVDPRDAADPLVAAALEAGGRDNATAVVIDVVGLVSDDAYDSERQLASLEHKLGARRE